MREFNITGVCNKSMHYMVDISNKLDELEKLIDKGNYFTINRARQFGKTTTMFEINDKLRDKYVMIKISFEGLGEKAFENEKEFNESFINLVSSRLKHNKLDKSIIGKWEENKQNINKFEELSIKITNLVEDCEKDIILMIDEVDKSSNNQLFLHFIGMLRLKYLDRNENMDKTFKSIILAGVYDVKNLKLKLRQDEEIIYNSPWNIATDFEVDMTFNPMEIATMLEDYEKENNTKMDIEKISKGIYEYTNGYPFLVSKVCKTIDERLGKTWSLEGIQEAVKIMQEEKNTLFDDLIKNINNNKDLYNTVYDMLILGKEKTYDVYTYEIGIMYGIFRKGEKGKLVIHNKIFEILLYNYLTINKELTETKIINYENRNQFIDDNNNIKMEKVLNKFAELMYEEYREGYQEFLEKEGRLIFLAFIKPIINGTGFYYVETETRTNRRMDIVITYNSKEYIIELKKWYGKKYEERGLNQLAEYLEIRKNKKGYAVVFDFSNDKHYKQEWIKVDGKDVYEVVV